jgi:eukaryotic-like serine/threonine-protein kinase
MMEAPTPDSLRVGDLVGPWRVEAYAGRGANGVVYRARRAGHPGSPPVALKLALFPSDPRFAREEKALSHFRHPSLPRLLDRGVWHASADVKYPYIVMEWIRGLPLYDWAREQRATSRQVLTVVAQVAWGLEVLHRGDFLHRDIKGGNILVEPEGRAVITDFGSITWAGAPPLTERILAPGTREYRSPEALLFELRHSGDPNARYEARPADDLYALGVSVYRLLTGLYPPLPVRAEELQGMPVIPPPPRMPPREINERVVPELATLVEQMLVRQPDARGSGREVAEAAESAAEHLGTAADGPLERNRPARAMKMPARRTAGAGSKARGVEPVSVRGRGSALPRSRSWKVRHTLGAAAGVLAVVGAGWVGYWQGEESVHVTQNRWRGGATIPRAGTKGLGDSSPTKQMAAQGAPVIAKSEAFTS